MLGSSAVRIRRETNQDTTSNESNSLSSTPLRFQTEVPQKQQQRNTLLLLVWVGALCVLSPRISIYFGLWFAQGTQRRAVVDRRRLSSLLCIAETTSQRYAAHATRLLCYPLHCVCLVWNITDAPCVCVSLLWTSIDTHMHKNPCHIRMTLPFYFFFFFFARVYCTVRSNSRT